MACPRITLVCVHPTRSKTVVYVDYLERYATDASVTGFSERARDL